MPPLDKVVTKILWTCSFKPSFPNRPGAEDQALPELFLNSRNLNNFLLFKSSKHLAKYRPQFVVGSVEKILPSCI